MTQEARGVQRNPNLKLNPKYPKSEPELSAVLDSYLGAFTTFETPIQSETSSNGGGNTVCFCATH